MSFVSTRLVCMDIMAAIDEFIGKPWPGLSSDISMDRKTAITVLIILSPGLFIFKILSMSIPLSKFKVCPVNEYGCEYSYYCINYPANCKEYGSCGVIGVIYCYR